MLAVAGAVVAGAGGLAIDRQLGSGARLPLGLASTVDSARSVLSTIAGATISFAGIAFSVSLLIIQLGSDQYSPRIVHTLFRDPFNKRVMALVVGTFTYCLVVLRSVRSPLEDGGEAVVPNLSVGVAVLLGIATILGIVAFIDHSAHSMDVSELLERVRRDAVEQVRAEWTRPGAEAAGDVEAPELAGEVHIVRFDRSGWVQQIDIDAVLAAAVAGGTIELVTFPGRYAVVGTPIARTVPPPADPDQLDASVRAAVEVGRTRTSQQDLSYGLRQLTDVALKALSPGVNDPTTAQDAIFHSAAVLAELLRNDPPPRIRRGPEGRRLVASAQPTHADLVRLAFDETSRAAATVPAVTVYLLEAIQLVREALLAEGLTDRTAPLVEQAGLALAASRHADLPAADRALVQSAHASRFSDS